MKKFWAILKYEYTRHVLRRRFLFALISLPLWIAFSIGMGILAVFLQSNNAPVGYVDQAGIVQKLDFPNLENDLLDEVTFLAFDSEAEAREALESNRIQAFFLLPEGFRETRSVRLFYLEEPDDDVISDFNDLLRANLLMEQPASIAQRIIDGPELLIEATQEERQMAENDWVKIFAPLTAAVFLIISIFTSSGYLMQAVVEEKENRTMEILATSVSPEQIMGGKILALILVGLTQVLIWSLLPVLFLGLAVAYIPFLQGISIDWKTIGLIFITVIPTFVLISALMATIGATVTEAREGQQVSSLVTLPVMAPAMLATPIVLNPGGPISLFLSFFPLTASLTLLIRIGFATVPVWQILISTGILILSAIGALWLSGRVFRLGMLQYGQRLGWKEVARAFRSGQESPATLSLRNKRE